MKVITKFEIQRIEAIFVGFEMIHLDFHEFNKELTREEESYLYLIYWCIKRTYNLDKKIFYENIMLIFLRMT